MTWIETTDGATALVTACQSGFSDVELATGTVVFSLFSPTEASELGAEPDPSRTLSRPAVPALARTAAAAAAPTTGIQVLFLFEAAGAASVATGAGGMPAAEYAVLVGAPYGAWGECWAGAGCAGATCGAGGAGTGAGCGAANCCVGCACGAGACGAAGASGVTGSCCVACASMRCVSPSRGASGWGTFDCGVFSVMGCSLLVLSEDYFTPGR
ncbi:hypothetical protein D3C74_358630 [compost metagenome]